MAINYAESADTKKRREYLEGLSASKPGAYQGENTQAAKDAMNALLNRKPFQYDVNEDTLYQQMKNDYIQQGKLAMQDTMGQAATLTGGYGNSYAQNVGQQAYNGYLQQVNENLPEYYQMAQNAYNAEGDRLKDQYALLADQEAQDYSRYQDAWNRWNSEYQNAQSAYETGRSWDYGVAQDNAALAQTQVNYLISQGITPNEELLAAAGYDQQYINQVVSANTPVKAVASYSGGGGGGGGGGKPPLTAQELREMYDKLKNAGASPTELKEFRMQATAEYKKVANEAFNGTNTTKKTQKPTNKNIYATYLK